MANACLEFGFLLYNIFPHPWELWFGRFQLSVFQYLRFQSFRIVIWGILDFKDSRLWEFQTSGILLFQDFNIHGTIFE
jgi:hypothetical protein